MTTTSTTQARSQATPTAVVDLDAIAHNVGILREYAGHAEVMAVVKADGYGHGASRVARAALAAGAAEVGVATVDEALALRRDGITAPVLCWLHPPGTDFAPALVNDVQLGVSSVRQVDEMAHFRKRIPHSRVFLMRKRCFFLPQLPDGLVRSIKQFQQLRQADDMKGSLLGITPKLVHQLISWIKQLLFRSIPPI